MSHHINQDNHSTKKKLKSTKYTFSIHKKKKLKAKKLNLKTNISQEIEYHQMYQPKNFLSSIKKFLIYLMLQFQAILVVMLQSTEQLFFLHTLSFYQSASIC